MLGFVQNDVKKLVRLHFWTNFPVHCGTGSIHIKIHAILRLLQVISLSHDSSQSWFCQFQIVVFWYDWIYLQCERGGRLFKIDILQES